MSSVYMLSASSMTLRADGFLKQHLRSLDVRGRAGAIRERTSVVDDDRLGPLRFEIVR